MGVDNEYAWIAAITVFLSSLLVSFFKGKKSAKKINPSPPPSPKPSEVAQTIIEGELEEKKQKIQEAAESEDPSQATTDILRGRRR